MAAEKPKPSPDQVTALDISIELGAAEIHDLEAKVHQLRLALTDLIVQRWDVQHVTVAVKVTPRRKGWGWATEKAARKHP